RSIAVVAKARERGMEIAIVDLFKAPTISALARQAEIRGVAAEEVTLAPFALVADADRKLLPPGLDDAYPLTMLQAGMVFHQQDAQEEGIYHDVFSHAIRVPSWNEAAMRSVLAALVRKHPVLRSSFALHGFSEALQLVHGDGEIPLEVFDIRHLDTKAQDRLASEFVDAERKTDFDFTSAPLLRVFIHLRSAETVQYTISFHHAILDGWSVASLQTELLAEYVRIAGRPGQMPELASIAAVPPAIAGERGALADPAHKAFWTAQLDGAGFAELPQPFGAAPEALRLRRSLEPEVVAQVELLATSLSVPVRSVLLAAHIRMLCLMCGQADVTTGLVCNVRAEMADADKALGLYLNTLPLRIKLERASWRELIQATHARELEVIAHRQFPYFQLHIDNGRRPYYDVMFNFTNFHVYEQVGELLDQGAFAQVFEATEMGLAIDCSHSGRGIELSAESRKLARGQLEGLLDAFASIIAAMAGDPGASHDEFNALPAAQNRLLVEQFNETAHVDREILLHKGFERLAQQQADAVALRHAGESWTYAQLNGWSNRIAHALLAAGVQPDDRVALCAPRSAGQIAAMLGILKAGAGYVPLDPGAPAERLQYLLQDCLPALLLADPIFTGQLDTGAIPLMSLDSFAVAEGEPSANPVIAGLESRNLAYVIYTSGSTGKPKGVMVEHRQAAQLVAHNIVRTGLGAGQRMLQFASFGFDASVGEIFTALNSGATLVLRPDDMLAPGSAFADFMRNERITATDVPTAFWHVWAGEVARGKALPNPELHTVIVGGEKAELQRLAEWQSCQATAGIRWINTYGPTEAAVFVTDEVRLPGCAQQPGEIPIGRPAAGNRLYVLGAFGQLLPPGATGELYIGGMQVARGYFNRSDLTVERFSADPFSKTSGARMYRTGDLVRWRDDGCMDYVGRNDFQLKIRGYRIEPAEIEQALSAQPGVANALVMALPQEGGDARLVAYVARQSGHDLTPAGLREALSACLASYMLPQAYVILDAFPLNQSGKLDRKALPALEADDLAGQEYAAPEGDAEKIIAAQWTELLGRERVGRHDNFFHLGGHSLAVVSMIERLRQAGLMADVRSVFAAPTVAGLAERLSAKPKADAQPAVPPNLVPQQCARIEPGMLTLVKLDQSQIDTIAAHIPGGPTNIQEIYPLAPMQTGILFHHLMEERGDTYLLRMVLEFDSRQRLQVFLAALQTVIARHDILRSAFMWEGLEEPVQVVLRDAPLAVHEVEHKGSDVLAALLTACDPRQMRLDLRSAPLMAAYIAEDRATGATWLSLLNHHLIGDHVTQESMIEEIRAVLAGQADALPAPAPYRDFVAAALATDPARQEEYFRGRLADVEEPTAPFGLLEVHTGGTGSSEHEASLDSATARAIRAAAANAGVSPAVLFHAAWAKVLAACTGRDDVVFGTVLLGRMQGIAGAGRVMGMFVNTLPLRLQPGALSAAELVRMTSEELSALLEHEQAPLSLAQRCSGVAAPAPLFSTLLNYRRSHSASGAAVADKQQAWEGIRVHANEERINYPIGMYVNDLGEDFSLTVQCDGVDPARMAGMMIAAVSALAWSLDKVPHAKVALLDVLPPAEHALIARMGAQAGEFDGMFTIHGRFEEQAAAHPDAIALTVDGQQLTYGELNANANRMAHRLLELGVQPDDRVAICAERGFGMIAGLLAIMKAGAGYVPLDPVYPDDRLAFMLGDCAPRVVLADSAL
ncbi:amino acid adenylation domain-containing protein, partial [Duganella sp. CF458]